MRSLFLFFRTLVGIGFLALSVGGAAAITVTSFVAGTQDLPLMPGLRETPANSMLFETEEGRIVESYAVGNVSATDILSFYASILPQLGWKNQSDTVYHRDSETLRLKITNTGKPLMVVFSIMPE